MHDLRVEHMHDRVGEWFQSGSVNATSRKVTSGLPAVVCTIICPHARSVFL